MMRYWRAFRRALDLSLKGESLQSDRLRATNPEVAEWCKETIRKVDAVLTSARTAQLDMNTLVVRVDGRDQSMLVILNTVRFHAEQEIPFLLTGGDPHRGLALQALNLNDRFAVSRLIEPVPPPQKTGVEDLAKHLETLPAFQK